MISLCTPTRGRPERFLAMVESAVRMTDRRFEVIAYRDEDDAAEYPEHDYVRYVYGPRPYVNGVLATSVLWTLAAEYGAGDIFMLNGDDNIFETFGWSGRVESVFSAVPDRIVMAYGDDGTRRKRPTGPFVSLEWIMATGEFTPAGYPGWCADTWLWTMAAQIERVAWMPDVRIRHYQRHGSDQTYRDGDEARAVEGGPHGVRARFFGDAETARRRRQTDKLRARLQNNATLPDVPEYTWYEEARRKP